MKKIFKLLFASFCAFPLLGGCSTGLDGETVHGVVESPMWFKTASRNTIVSHFSEFCDSYGIPRGTSEFRSCVRDSEQASRSNTMSNYRSFISDINANSTNNELNSLKSGLQTQCILDGKVWLGNRCM